jgi:hypothetical protein
MANIDEHLSARFLAWERRGRGWDIFPHPVAPEPPFVPFRRRGPPQAPADDGRRPTAISSLVRSLSRGLSTRPRPAEPPPEGEDAEEPPPLLVRGECAELPLFLPPSFTARGPDLAQLLDALAACAEPVSFEVFGTSESVAAQLAVSEGDEPHARAQLRAFFPDLACAPTAGRLAAAWDGAGEIAGAVEFGLARETMLPLASFGGDLCVPIVGALSDLRPGECGVFQVTFRAASRPWGDSLVRSVNEGGGAFFANAPELASAARQKASRPLFCAVVRIATRAESHDRAWEMARQMASGLRALASIGGNELIPLRNDGYPFEAHVADVTRRQSGRSGMILTSDELLGLVRLPTAAVRSPKFLRIARKTKAAPDAVTGPAGTPLGVNEHAGVSREVRLTAEQRTRHVHLIGASGTGKSTLLLNMIRHDMEGGQGLAVLDPHGDLVDAVLGAVPPERVGDVVLLDPADEEFVVGFNVLAAHSEWERGILAADLVAVFRRLSTSWGDQMNSVFGKAIHAFLESERGGTLADLRRFLLEPAYREEFLKTVRDPDVVYYWRKGFAQLSGNKSVGPILTRLETFLSPRPIRRMVSQAGNRLDFSAMMDEGRIFLGRLSQGAIGRENAHLLGSLLVSKFQQAAMGRQRRGASARRDFWLYADEFADFITPSMAEILQGARKYRMGMTLAHQELRQMEREPDVASAVMANCHTRVVFRVSDRDARALEQGFTAFEARDLQSLGTGEAVARVERGDFDFNLAVPRLPYPGEAEASARREEVRAASRARYATPRSEVEAAGIARALEADASAPAERVAKAPRKTPPPDPEEPPHPPPPPPVPQAPPPVAPAANPTPAPSSPPAPRPSAPPSADAGRGGMQHKAIQKRIKEAAEALGFRAAIEHPILDGAGSVDLALSRADLSIACEITVTTTIDHEVGNVAKCLRAGYARVAVVASTAERLAKIETAVAAGLGPEAAALVSYHLPDQLIEHLRGLPMPAPSAPEPSVRETRGYRVRRTYPKLSPEEAAAREEDGIRAIAEALRRKP